MYANEPIANVCTATSVSPPAQSAAVRGQPPAGMVLIKHGRGGDADEREERRLQEERVDEAGDRVDEVQRLAVHEHVREAEDAGEVEVRPDRVRRPRTAAAGCS